MPARAVRDGHLAGGGVRDKVLQDEGTDPGGSTPVVDLLAVDQRLDAADGGSADAADHIPVVWRDLEVSVAQRLASRGDGEMDVAVDAPCLFRLDDGGWLKV